MELKQWKIQFFSFQEFNWMCAIKKNFKVKTESNNNKKKNTHKRNMIALDVHARSFNFDWTLSSKTCSILNHLNPIQTQRTQWKQRWDEVSLFVYRFSLRLVVRVYEDVKVFSIVVCIGDAMFSMRYFLLIPFPSSMFQ